MCRVAYNRTLSVCAEDNVTGLKLFTFVSPDDQDDDADSTSLELNDNLVFLWSSARGGAQWPRRVVTAPAHSACTGHVPLAAWPELCTQTRPDTNYMRRRSRGVSNIQTIG